jgi:hypothetical protein
MDDLSCWTRTLPDHLELRLILPTFQVIDHPIVTALGCVCHENNATRQVNNEAPATAGRRFP